MTAWNAGELPVLLVNPQSVAHGLNLQGGRAVIFHSLTWNLEDYEQLVRRIWRQGQTKKVFVYHIAARRTVDEVILEALARKGKTQERLLGALRGYAARRRGKER
jgi:SNF2 family DNA or RNA helicase